MLEPPRAIVFCKQRSVKDVRCTNGGSVSHPWNRGLVDLEIRYTHLERQVAELSEVVFAHQWTIDGLLRQLSSTKAEIAELSAPVANEKPPHY